MHAYRIDVGMLDDFLRERSAHIQQFAGRRVEQVLDRYLQRNGVHPALKSMHIPCGAMTDLRRQQAKLSRLDVRPFLRTRGRLQAIAASNAALRPCSQHVGQ